jgi:hypothetical protein
MGVFSVIPAKAGIQSPAPGSKPAPDSDPGSGMAVACPANSPETLAIAIYECAFKAVRAEEPSL